MKLLAIDPSGNYKEGKGTTGIAFFEDGEIIDIDEIKASDYDTAEEYWMTHLALIAKILPDQVVMEGFKLYNHKKSEQVNSELETSQMIGVIKMHCYMNGIPLAIQFASEVKTRWSDKVLVSKEILEEGNKWKGQRTSTHKRDSIRHGLHWWRYKSDARSTK